MHQNRRFLLERLLIDLHQGQHIAVPQRVGEFVVALLLHALHRDLTGGVEHCVDTGIDDAGIVLKNAVEHLEPVLRELARAIEVVLPVFLFRRFLCRSVEIHCPALGRRQQRVNLTL